MMLDGYIAKDHSGIFCFFFAEPSFCHGTWVGDNEDGIVMMPEDIPEELREMNYLDSPVRYTLIVSVITSRPYEED